MSAFTSLLTTLFHSVLVFGLKGIYIWCLMRLKSEIVVNLHGHQVLLRCGTSDEWLLYHVFSKKQYHIRLEKCETIIDLGANVGLTTIYLKELYPKAKVICVEPDGANYALLQYNTRGLDEVLLYNAAIGPYSGWVNVVESSIANPWATQVAISSEGSVRMITVSDILEAEGIKKIDLLKIDIEGFEKELFSANFLSWLPLVHVVVIEIHDNLSFGCGQVFFEAINAAFDSYSISIRASNLIVTNHSKIVC